MSEPPQETVLLSMGSNIEPERHLLAATGLLAERLRLSGASRVYETVPVGTTQGPRFLNAALEVRYGGEPQSLKQEILRPLEERLGRLRTADRNAPRTIDLDISLFGDRVVERPGLVIPDPEVLTRAHVAVPLADLAPDFRHPLEGISLAEIAAGLDRSGIVLRPDLALWPPSG